jgi:hypothetical protein
MDPIQRIRELLANLANLTSEELSELDGLVDGEMKTLDKVAVPDIALLDEVVQAAEQSAAESARRVEVEAQTQKQAEELRSRFKTVRGEVDPNAPEAPAEEEAPAETETAPVEGETAPAEGETVAPVEGEQLPVAASVSGRASRMAGATGRTVAAPVSSRPVALVASGLGRGAQVGEELDSERLAEIMTRTIESMPRNGAPRGPVIVASADYRSRFPEERRLDDNPTRNGIKIHNAAKTGPGQKAALTASGGICSPVNIDWSVDVFAVADTPLVNGLMDFQADRGGLTFIPPPDIAALASATSVWTEADDAGAPGNDLTKPVLSIACGGTTTVYVDAVPTRLGFGNMEGRFAPEWVAANTELSVAAAARIRELNLLAKIDAASSLVNSYNLLGTARDILATVDQVLAYYRDVHRLSDTQGFTAVFPRWMRDAFRADIARELAHDEDDSNPLAVPNEQIDAYLAARNVKAIWMLDGRVAKSSGGDTLEYPVQTYTKVTTNNPIPPWITKTVWNLFVDGTFQRLDAGILDIGVVRDSTLDATNDYEIFTEVFEGIAFRGIEALTVISPILPNGGSAGTIATSSYTGA